MNFNKKAESEPILKGNLVTLMFLVIFTVGMLLYINGKTNGAQITAEQTAKELSKVINLAEPGDQITINIQSLTELARRNDITVFSEIFNFNNQNNEICVKLEKSRQTCYKYFNNVDVISPTINYGLSDLQPNTLSFTIAEKT